jgi:hypothetical protein
MGKRVTGQTDKAQADRIGGMRDRDIRDAMLRYLEQEVAAESDALIVEELGLCEGEARVDIAVVNGSIHGFEIKSDQDTLKRLSGQAAIYNRVLDRVTLVVTKSHLDEALRVIPPWWGILVAFRRANEVWFKRRRKGRLNPITDPLAVAQLLWRDEAFAALKERNLHKGLAKRPRASLWETLSNYVPASEIGDLVRNTLKTRENWRSGY